MQVNGQSRHVTHSSTARVNGQGVTRTPHPSFPETCCMYTRTSKAQEGLVRVESARRLPENASAEGAARGYYDSTPNSSPLQTATQEAPISRPWTDLLRKKARGHLAPSNDQISRTTCSFPIARPEVITGQGDSAPTRRLSSRRPLFWHGAPGADNRGLFPGFECAIQREVGNGRLPCPLWPRNSWRNVQFFFLFSSRP